MTPWNRTNVYIQTHNVWTYSHYCTCISPNVVNFAINFEQGNNRNVGVSQEKLPVVKSGETWSLTAYRAAAQLLPHQSGR